jgi:hypothetical protein
MSSPDLWASSIAKEASLDWSKPVSLPKDFHEFRTIDGDSYNYG